MQNMVMICGARNLNLRPVQAISPERTCPGLQKPSVLDWLPALVRKANTIHSINESGVGSQSIAPEG